MVERVKPCLHCEEIISFEEYYCPRCGTYTREDEGEETRVDERFWRPRGRALAVVSGVLAVAVVVLIILSVAALVVPL